jgi:hypothetical protein
MEIGWASCGDGPITSLYRRVKDKKYGIDYNSPVQVRIS